MNRSGSRHSRKSSRSRDRSSRYRSSEEVNLINFSEYVFLEPINDSGSNIPVELDSDPEIKFIDHVYKEGNHDIDPFKGIIDSGCPRTVAGRPWLDAYIESKGDIKVKRSKENELFKFGPSEIFKSDMSYEIDIEIGTLKEKIKVSVVDADIPLLIGLDCQRLWGMVLDLGRNEIFIRKSGEHFPMTAESMHWTLPIQRSSLHQEASNLVYKVDFEAMDKNAIRKHIVKVHKNLCHKSADHLRRLFSMAWKDTPIIKDTIKNVVDTCNVCKRFKKTPARPKVALPKANTTNEVVSVDLKERRDLGKYILYICDEFSGYMMAEVVNDKLPETIMKAFNKRWVRDGPGIPLRGIFADNGGEFKNPVMKQVASKYGISLRLTAANSPWSNGKNERNHYTCDLITEKLMDEDATLSLSDAVSHAVNAKNMQINKTGFSPRQLMFGKQSVIPGITDGTPATMEPVIESDSFRRELVNRQKSEELYRKIDANERIQKILAQRTYGYTDLKYKEGDLVLFKENEKNRWSGPAVVTGMEGSKVRLVHAGYDRTVPSCRVIPFSEERNLIENPTSVSNDKEENVDQLEPRQTLKIPDNNLREEEEFGSASHLSSDEVISAESCQMEVRPKRNRIINFKVEGENFWRTGKVLSVGKKTGKDKNRCWIKCKNEKIDVDFARDISEWNYSSVTFDESATDTSNTRKIDNEVLSTGVWYLKHKELLENDSEDSLNEVFVVEIPEKDHDDPDILLAKEEEIEKWVKYGAYEEVDYDHQFVLGSRWVVVSKNGVPKARFVVKGFHEKENPRSDSPTAHKESLKLFLALAANEEFKIKSLDVTSAFLQGYPLDREVFIQPPKGFSEEGKVWKLLKSCYGLNDASRKWFMAVQESLLSLGMKSVSGDDAFFYKAENGVLSGMCILHVDDFLIAGTKQFYDDVQVGFPLPDLASTS